MVLAEKYEIDDIFDEVVDDIKEDEGLEIVASDEEVWDHVLCVGLKSTYMSTTDSSKTVFRILDLIPGCCHSREFYDKFDIIESDDVTYDGEYKTVHNGITQYKIYNDDTVTSGIYDRYECCGLTLKNTDYGSLWKVGEILFWLTESDGYKFGIDDKPENDFSFSDDKFEKFMSKFMTRLSGKTLASYEDYYRNKMETEFNYCMYNQMIVVKLLNLKVQQAYHRLSCFDCLEEYIVSPDFIKTEKCQYLLMSIDFIRRLASNHEFDTMLALPLTSMNREYAKHYVSGKRILRSDVFATASKIHIFLEIEHDYDSERKYYTRLRQRPNVLFLYIEICGKTELKEALDFLIGEKNKGPFIMISQEVYGT